MSSAYRGVIEQYANDNILLNIVRTSKNMPMSFLDIPSVVGSGNLVGSANLSSSVLSSDPTTISGFLSARAGSSNTSYSPSVGMSISNGFTFTQASLDNSQFMQAFLKEVPLNTINFRGTEANLPKSVLYSLLIDTVQVRSANNEIVATWKNDPTAPAYHEFQSVLYLLVDLGLKTEVKTSSESVGPPISEQDFIKNMGSVAEFISKQGGGLTLVKHVKKDKTYYQLTRYTSHTRACVNGHLARKILGNRLTDFAYCEDSPVDLEATHESHSALLEKFGTQYSNLNLLIRLRSTGNIFNYLGDVLNAQTDSTNPYLVSIKSSHTSHEKKIAGQSKTEIPLFKVYKNQTPRDSIYSVDYRGDTYALSASDDSYTSKVMEFVSTLLTANKIPGTTPSTPAIVIR